MTDHLDSTDEEKLLVAPDRTDTADAPEMNAITDSIDEENDDMYLTMGNEIKDLCRDELRIEVDLEFLIKGIKLRGLLFSRFLELLGTYGDDYEKLTRHGFRYTVNVEDGKDVLHLVIYRSPGHVCTVKNIILKTDRGFTCEPISSEVRMELRLENGGTEMVSIETYDNIPHLQRIPKILYPESFEV